MKGSLRNARQSFICRCCKVDGPITDGLNTDFHLDIGNAVSLEKVDKFCYLADMLDADGGCNSAIAARVRSAWKKFREYLPILTGKGFSLKLKGKVYATYGSFRVNSTNFLELSSMTTSEFDEIFKTRSLNIHKKACKISG